MYMKSRKKYLWRLVKTLVLQFKVLGTSNFLLSSLFTFRKIFRLSFFFISKERSFSYLYHCLLNSHFMSTADTCIFFVWQGGFILDMGVHFIAGLRMVISSATLDN